MKLRPVLFEFDVPNLRSARQDEETRVEPRRESRDRAKEVRRGSKLQSCITGQRRRG